MRAKGSTLICARCDNSVPEGSASCPWQLHGTSGRAGRGTACGSRAFYRVGAKPVRHIMGEPLPDDVVPLEGEAPVFARAKHNPLHRMLHRARA